MKSRFVVIALASGILGAALSAAEPPIRVTVDPREGLDVIYAAVGAVTANDPPTGRLWMKVGIQNDGGSTLTLTNIRVSLTGVDRSIARNLDCPAGSTVSTGFNEAEVIVIPHPAAASMTLRLYFQGNATPKTLLTSLAPYVSPTPNGQYLFPADEGDIGPDQYFSGGSHEGNHSQLWGTDWKVYGVSAAGSVDTVRPGGDPARNEDHFGWGVPIRSLGEGIVLRTTTGWSNNPTAGTRAFQKMGEYDGEAISDVKVTRMSTTRAASLARLPGGNIQVSIWDLANNSRQIMRRGSSPIVAQELVTEISLDALTSSRLIAGVRLNSGILRLIVWDVSTNGSVTRIMEHDDLAVTEVSLMKMENSSTRFTTGLRTAGGNLRVIVWQVGSTNLQLLAEDSAGAATSINTTSLTSARLAASVRDSGGSLKVIVWDFVDNRDGTYSLDRRGEATADAITRVAAYASIGSKWVTAMRTNPGGLLKLIRWSPSNDGMSITQELATAGESIQDQSLALTTGTGSDGPDNMVTASINAVGNFKINGWGDPNELPGAYEFSAQNEAGPVNKVSIDETEDLEFFVGARTSAGDLKIMTWLWAHGGGNSVYVLHGNCRVLYAHFQDGSVNTNVLFPGARVGPGQFLGRMGNSGASGAPHTHIHSDRLASVPPIDEIIALEAADALEINGTRPMPFHSARARRLTLIGPGGEGNATNDFGTMTGHGMYDVALGIRPRTRTLYVDQLSTFANPNGRKEPLPGIPPTGGPFPTVAEGLGAATSGTRLYIRGGSYNESVTFNTPMTVRRYDYYRTEGSALIR